jgi:hypothetical protein
VTSCPASMKPRPVAVPTTPEPTMKMRAMVRRSLPWAIG